MAYTTLANTPLITDPSFMAVDQGWRISGDKAIHSGCNPGVLTSSSITLYPGQWTIEYTVSDYISGNIYAILGGVNATSYSSSGDKKDTVTVLEGEDYTVKFYSDGDLAINFTAVYPVIEQQNNATTLAFDIKENKYVTRYSYAPEMMLRFTNNFFTFYNGELWKQNANDVCNNFYGVQYSSSLFIVCNVNYNLNKQWYSLRLDSKGKWFAPTIKTPKSDLFPNGMLSRLKKNNFEVINNKRWADILRDMTDPKFKSIEDESVRQIEALMGGRMMEGTLLAIEFKCDDITLSRLESVTVYYSETDRNL